MSLAIKYETVDDARMRLKNSVVLYKEIPVYVKDVMQAGGKDAEGGKDKVFRVLFTELPLKSASDMNGRLLGGRVDQNTDESVRKFISSKHFDIAPFKLGYVNDKVLGAFHCSRLPNRIQKQGLCSENFQAANNRKQAIMWSHFLCSEATPSMIANRYPSFDVALALLDKVHSVAFSREFCLTRDEVIPKLVYLFYKTNKIGIVQNKEIVLGPEYNCLKESLEELKVRITI